MAWLGVAGVLARFWESTISQGDFPCVCVSVFLFSFQDHPFDLGSKGNQKKRRIPVVLGFFFGGGDHVFRLKLNLRFPLVGGLVWWDEGI